MLLAEFGTGQVLWSIVWLFAFALHIALALIVFFEIVKAPYLSGVAKAVWTIAIALLPYAGLLLFLLLHGDEMRGQSQGTFMSEEEAYATGQVSYYTEERRP